MFAHKKLYSKFVGVKYGADMLIKRNLNCRLENRKKDGQLIVENVPIRIRVTYAGNRIELTTGIRIDRNKWDDKKGRAKANIFNRQNQSATDINSALTEYVSHLEKIFKTFEVENKLPTTEELKFEFNKIFPQKGQAAVEKKFFDYFDEFVQDNGVLKDWTASTYEKFATVKNHLQKFNNHLSFNYFNEAGLTKYVEFLREVCLMRNSTIEKQISFLKWFLNWAKSKGYNKTHDFEIFRPKLKSTQKKIIFLDPSELQQLKNLDIKKSKNYLEKVRDIYLFLCYSGLRYSDVLNLKKTDIKENSIEVTTVKTADSLIIELNDYSKKIIEKYKDDPIEGGKALPVISNQKMNVYLRELCKLAGIDQPIRQTYYRGNERIDEIRPKYEVISTHSGRRTFICNALALGIPVNVIMKWTGHSDYKSMKPYIDIADNYKSESMKKFNLL